MVVLLVLVAMLTPQAMFTPPAMAIPPAVERLYEEGKTALKESDPVMALGRFKDALRRAKGDEGWTWRLLLAVALAYKVSDQPQHAIEYFRRFLAQTDAHQATMTMKWKRRREIAANDLVTLETAVESTHGFVSITSKPAGAQISVDGTRAGADGDAMTPFGLILSPGKHLIRITLAGYMAGEQRVTVRAGDSQPLRLELVPEGAPATPIAAPPAPVAEPPPPPTPEPAVEPPPSIVLQPTETASPATLTATASEPDEGNAAMLAYVTMGSGAAAAVAAVTMTVMASGERKAMDEASRGIKSVGDDYERGHALSQDYTEADEARALYEITAGILYGVALAGVATGVILLLVAEPDETSQASATTPAFDLSPTQGGLYGQATWSF